MSVINFPSTSPYFTTGQTSWYTGPINFRAIPPDTNDSFIPSLDKKYENRPDRLSQDLYNTPAYWWVFMVRNMDTIRDPIWDMVAGISIYVPSASYLQSIVG
jgi:hypothetical protein